MQRRLKGACLHAVWNGTKTQTCMRFLHHSRHLLVFGVAVGQAVGPRIAVLCRLWGVVSATARGQDPQPVAALQLMGTNLAQVSIML